MERRPRLLLRGVRWRVVATILLVTLTWLAGPQAASAHPELVKSSPEAGSITDSSPQQLELYFTEGVSLGFSTIKLLDRARREQPIGVLEKIGVADTDVKAIVTNPLPSGVYTVVWRVLSSVDGHLIAGSFAFRVRGSAPDVGTPEAIEPVVPLEDVGGGSFEGTAPVADPFRWVIRAVTLAAAVLLLGGPLVTILIIDPASAERGERGALLKGAADRRFARVGAVAGAILFAALIVDLAMQVASIGATDLAGALNRGDQGLSVINSTRYGFSWALRTLSALGLIGIMLFIWVRARESVSGLWEVGIAAASLYLLGQSLGSHAAAVANAPQIAGLPLPVVNDWLHLVVVSAWVGGLCYLALALFPAFRAIGSSPEERRLFLGSAIPRFSKVAIGSVVLLALTGTLNLAIHSTDLGVILASPYGQVLALKVGLFAALVGIGAINLRRLTPLLRALPAEGPGEGGGPQIERGEGRPVRQLRRNVRLEIALAAVALLCAGGLTLLPPPSGARGESVAQGGGPGQEVADAPTPADAAPTPIPTPGPATAQSEVAGYNFTLTTRPSLEGDELSLRIRRVDEASPPLTDVLKVLLKVTPQDIDAGSTSYEAARDGEAGPDEQLWSLTDTILTLDGGYLVTAVVQRTESADVKAAFRLDLSLESGLSATTGQVVDVRVATGMTPPITGTSALTITLLDGARRPIEGAKVTINPFMPAHAHIEPVSVAVPVPGTPGAYSSEILFDMGGSWLFIFDIEREGQPALKTDASLEVIDPNGTPTPEPALDPSAQPTAEPPP